MTKSSVEQASDDYFNWHTMVLKVHNARESYGRTVFSLSNSNQGYWYNEWVSSGNTVAVYNVDGTHVATATYDGWGFNGINSLRGDGQTYFLASHAWIPTG